MKYLLFFGTIYVLTRYSDQHLVVLNQEPKTIISEQHLVEDEHEDSETLSKIAESNESLQEDTNESEQSDNNTNVYKGRKVKNWTRWVSEIAAGNPLEIMGTNPHIYQPDAYPELNRRFVLQYPYSETVPQVGQNIAVAPAGQEIVPIEAPKEIVALVAKESAMRVASKPIDPEIDTTKLILRTGDYWNGVWKEDVNPKMSLRTSNDPVLRVIKAKIMPGNEFYDVVARMKKISPRLLYIINEDNKD